jgi:hypothetical protein
VASPLCCILSLWLERIGDAIFSLMPPKAMTSSIFMDLEVGVDGEKVVTAIRGVFLPSSACFSPPDGAFSEISKLLLPTAPLHGES